MLTSSKLLLHFHLLHFPPYNSWRRLLPLSSFFCIWNCNEELNLPYHQYQIRQISPSSLRHSVHIFVRPAHSSSERSTHCPWWPRPPPPGCTRSTTCNPGMSIEYRRFICGKVASVWAPSSFYKIVHIGPSQLSCILHLSKQHFVELFIRSFKTKIYQWL